MNDLFQLLRCPRSKKKLIYDKSKNLLTSSDTGIEYDIIKDIPIIFLENRKIDQDIINWWGDLYKQLYFNFDNNLTKTKLIYHLEKFRELMHAMDHLLSNEMLQNDIKNKICLEIGSGSGAHSAFMQSLGAKMISVDITMDRCLSTSKKLQMIDKNNSLVLNCSAEQLALDNDCVDIVYSNGVLHHTNSTENCISEINRVLKPGGRAIISLYCRSSVEYYFNLLPKALIFGSIFRHKDEANWIGEITEGKTKFSDIKNPVTRVYNKNEMLKLFKNFNVISLRKHCFSFKDFCIPRLTQFREKFLNLLGYKYYEGGNIVYGRPVIPYTNLEKSLGKYLGFFWYITVEKK